MKELGIEIHLNSEVKDLASLHADEVVVATGSKARRFSKLPGIERSVEACEYLEGKPVGDNVLICGGGLTGCEIAYELYLKGKHPIIVEMKDDLIAQKGVCMANSTYLRNFFLLHQVPTYLETSLVAIGAENVTLKGKDGKEFDVKADSVIMSVGYIPTPLAEEGKHVHLVGDCNGIGNLRTVIWRAYDVAMAI